MTNPCAISILTIRSQRSTRAHKGLGVGSHLTLKVDGPVTDICTPNSKLEWGIRSTAVFGHNQSLAPETRCKGEQRTNESPLLVSRITAVRPLSR
jgi:hypothetical protein